MKRILVTGANGLLGQKLTALLAREFEVLATDLQAELLAPEAKTRYQPLDITKAGQCREVIRDWNPDAIVNAAAYTDVDGCEEHKELCWQVNVRGVENLANAARKNMAMLVHVSSDYVFDGKNGPYAEDDPPRPLGYYGKAKLASENAVRLTGIPYTIIRTNVLFGVGNRVKNNFFLWAYHSLKDGKSINIVTDQYNNPTLAEELAEGILLSLRKSAYGVFHISGLEYLNRYEFTLKIADAFGFSRDLIRPITTDMLKQKAPRPMRGGLKIEKAQRELGFSPRPLGEILEMLKQQLEG